MMFRFDEYITFPLPIQDELLHLFDKNDKLVIVEAGCCEGEDTIKYARLFPNATIIAFEPIVTNYSLCKKNIDRYNLKERVALMDYAVSDKISKEYMYVSEGHPQNLPKSNEWQFGNKSSSLLKPEKQLEVYKWCEFKKQQQVKTIYLDYLFEIKKINTIDLLHLSVQGAELLALKGLTKNIDKTAVIYLKIALQELYKSQPLKKDIETYLSKSNFELVMERDNEIEGDELFVNRKYLK